MATVSRKPGKQQVIGTKANGYTQTTPTTAASTPLSSAPGTVARMDLVQLIGMRVSDKISATGTCKATTSNAGEEVRVRARPVCGPPYLKHEPRTGPQGDEVQPVRRWPVLHVSKRRGEHQQADQQAHQRKHHDSKQLVAEWRVELVEVLRSGKGGGGTGAVTGDNCKAM